LYIQIAEGLLKRIESGELLPGNRLPSERELSESLGVTRMTLRQALELLQKQGLLERKQGVGTFVADLKIERQANHLVPFTKGMQKRGFKPGARLLALEQQLAEVSVAKVLHLPVSAPVYYLHRLRFINREPTMVEKIMFPAHRFPNLEQYDFAARSLYEVLETEYGVFINHARQSFEAVQASTYEGDLLKIACGSPLMLEERVAYDQTEDPVEYAKDLYRGDRFRFVTEMAPLKP
jgi:GntR family transcriptional regulator